MLYDLIWIAKIRVEQFLCSKKTIPKELLLGDVSSVRASVNDSLWKRYQAMHSVMNRSDAEKTPKLYKYRVPSRQQCDFTSTHNHARRICHNRRENLVSEQAIWNFKLTICGAVAMLSHNRSHHVTALPDWNFAYFSPILSLTLHHDGLTQISMSVRSNTLVAQQYPLQSQRTFDRNCPNCYHSANVDIRNWNIIKLLNILAYV